MYLTSFQYIFVFFQVMFVRCKTFVMRFRKVHREKNKSFNLSITTVPFNKIMEMIPAIDRITTVLLLRIW